MRDWTIDIFEVRSLLETAKNPVIYLMISVTVSPAELALLTRNFGVKHPFVIVNGVSLLKI